MAEARERIRVMLPLRLVDSLDADAARARRVRSGQLEVLLDQLVNGQTGKGADADGAS